MDPAEHVLQVEGACEATCLWLKGNYEECLQTLQRLESTAGGPQVAHNLAIVEYYSGGCTATQKLQDQLTSIEAGVRQEGAEDAGASASGASSSTAPSPRPSAAAASVRPRSAGSSHSDSTAAGRAQDPDTALCRLNKAILLHRQQQHAASAALLGPLVHGWGDAAAEVLPEGVALRAVCLLLDILLDARHLGPAAAALTRLEQVCSHLSSAPALPFSSLLLSPGPTAAAAAAAAAAPPRAAAVEGCGTPALPRVSKWRAGSGVQPAAALLHRQGLSPPGPPDLTTLVGLYRARLLCATGDVRAARRVLNGGGAPPAAAAAALPGAAPTAAGAGGAVGSAVGVLQARLDLASGRPQSCSQRLQGLLRELPGAAAAAAAGAAVGGAAPAPSQALRAALLNDLGVAHAQQGKHALAALHCSQALLAMGPGAGSAVAAGGSGLACQAAALSGGAPAPGPFPAPPSSSASCSDQYCATLYNLGLQHLLLSRWHLARRCFQQAAPLYFSQPLLWLRMGEAALGLARQQRQEEAQARPVTSGAAAAAASSASSHPLLQGVVGEGSYRRVIFPAGNGTSGLEPPAPGAADPGTSAAAAVVALAREAVACLDTSLHLLTLQGEALAADVASSAPQQQAIGAGGWPDARRPQVLSLPDAASTSEAADTAAAVAASLALEAGGQGADGHTPQQRRRHRQLHAAQCFALGALAYAHLLLGDHLPALAAAQDLLGLPQLPASSHLLGSCYAAEALASVGRATEAAEMLAACVSHQLHAQQVAAAEQQRQQQPQQRSLLVQGAGDNGGSGSDTEAAMGLVAGSSGERAVVCSAADVAALTGPGALATLYVNLASLYASHGALAQAQQLARQALALPTAAGLAHGRGPAASLPAATVAAAATTRHAAHLLLVYVELAAGNTATALELLKLQRPLC